MNKFVANLKEKAEENPLATIAVVALAVTATAKLIDAMGHAAGSTAYARSVEHRIHSK